MLRTFKAWVGSFLAGFRHVWNPAPGPRACCGAGDRMWRVRACADQVLRARRSRQRRRASRGAIAQGRRGRRASTSRPHSFAAMPKRRSPAIRSARLRSSTSAISADPKVASPWLLLSRAALAIDAARQSRSAGGFRSAPPSRPMSPICGPRAKPEEAAALAGLGEAFARREMLAARARRLPRQPRLGRRRRPFATAYEALREEHGFSIADYKVDSDAASPRVCFQLLRPAGARQGGFRALRRRGRRGQCGCYRRGAAALRRRAQAWRALRHRAAAGPALRCRAKRLLKSADYEIYVRDRSAAGPLHRQELRPAARRARRASRSSRSTRPRSPPRSSASATATCSPLVRSEDFLAPARRLQGPPVRRRERREDLEWHARRAATSSTSDVDHRLSCHRGASASWSPAST